MHVLVSKAQSPEANGHTQIVKRNYHVVSQISISWNHLFLTWIFTLTTNPMSLSASSASSTNLDDFGLWSTRCYSGHNPHTVESIKAISDINIISTLSAMHWTHSPSGICSQLVPCTLAEFISYWATSS